MVYYKIGYVSALGFVLLLVAVSYGLILVSMLRTSVSNEQQDQRIGVVGKKVAVIVGVKFSTWVFVLTIMVYTMVTERLVGSTWYEITAITILPLNSCLNPVFHSDLYKKITALCTRMAAGTVVNWVPRMARTVQMTFNKKPTVNPVQEVGTVRMVTSSTEEDRSVPSGEVFPQNDRKGEAFPQKLYPTSGREVFAETPGQIVEWLEMGPMKQTGG
eukprot:sb/3469979/